MARKANKDMPTIAKTYMFYIDDVNEALNKDLQPKHVFRIGLKAINGNPQIIERLNDTNTDLSTTKERLFRITKMLELQCRKTEQLETKLIEMGVKLDNITEN